MIDSKKISAVVLTYNEEPNIERTLNSLMWLTDVVVIDSYSDDNTVKICEQFSNVTVFQRKFDNHTMQWTYGLEKAANNWILSLDSDYTVTQKLKEEILSLNLSSDIVAYSIPFDYLVFAKPLFSTILPPRIAFFDKNHCSYFQDGHTQMLRANGNVGKLKNVLLHDDRKSLKRWIWAQDRYANLELSKLNSQQDISFVDKIRTYKFIAPFLVFFYTLFVKGNIFSGKRGVYYALQRMYAELLISLKLIEHEYNERNKFK